MDFGTCCGFAVSWDFTWGLAVYSWKLFNKLLGCKPVSLNEAITWLSLQNLRSRSDFRQVRDQRWVKGLGGLGLRGFRVEGLAVSTHS